MSLRFDRPLPRLSHPAWLEDRRFVEAPPGASIGWGWRSPYSGPSAVAHQPGSNTREPGLFEQPGLGEGPPPGVGVGPGPAVVRPMFPAGDCTKNRFALPTIAYRWSLTNEPWRTPLVSASHRSFGHKLICVTGSGRTSTRVAFDEMPDLPPLSRRGREPELPATPGVSPPGGKCVIAQAE